MYTPCMSSPHTTKAVSVASQYSQGCGSDYHIDALLQDCVASCEMSSACHTKSALYSVSKIISPQYGTASLSIYYLRGILAKINLQLHVDYKTGSSEASDDLVLLKTFSLATTQKQTGLHTDKLHIGLVSNV